MAVNSPMRRMFGIPGQSAIHRPVSVGAAMGPPTGKGVLMRSLERHVGSPPEFAHRARDAGLSWVPILSLWQFDQAPPPNADVQAAGGAGQLPPFPQKAFNQEIGNYAAALQQVNVQPWLWGHPLARPDAVDVFVEVMGTLCKSVGAGGIIIEPRGSWAMQQGTDNMAANLVSKLRQQSGGRQVGVMSFASPQQHPLPWGVFGQVSDFGSPWSGGEEDPEQAAQEYSAAGFRTVVPVLGPDKQPLPAPSQLWWDWHELGQKDGRWATVKAFGQQPQAAPG